MAGGMGGGGMGGGMGMGAFPPGMGGGGSGAQDVRAQRGGVTPSGRSSGPAGVVRFDTQQQQQQQPMGRDRMSRSSSGNLRDMPRDGRGNQQGGRDMRDRGRAMQNNTPNLPPVAPLSKSATRWEAGMGVSSAMEGIKKKALSLLNKLTIDKFEVISAQLIDLIRSNVAAGQQLLGELVTILFEKALDEAYFSGMYSDLCVKISTEVADLFEDTATPAVPSTPVAAAAAEDGQPPPTPAAKKKSLFRLILLNECQQAFQRGVQPVEADGKSKEEVAELELVQKRRMLGNIRFIGELYKKQMIVEKIMHACVQHLLGQLDAVQEEDLEALCNLLTTIGKKLDHKKAESHMTTYFDRLHDILQTNKLSSRIRFMILDLLDLRKNHWTPRTKKAEAKSKEQVRQESEQEAIQKAGGGGGRGGGGGMIAQSPSSMNRGGNTITMLGGSRISMPSAGGHSKQASGGAQDVRMLSSSGSSTPLTTTVTSGGAAKRGVPPAGPPPLLAPAGARSASPNPTLSSQAPLRPGGGLMPQGPQGTRKPLSLQKRTTTTVESAPSPSSSSATPTPPSASPTDTSDASSLPRSSSSTQVSMIAAATEDAGVLDKQVEGILKEYAVGGDWSEIRALVAETLKDANSEPALVQHALDIFINSTRWQAQMSELVVRAYKEELISQQDIDRGVSKALSLLTAEFISEEMPAATKRVGAMLAPYLKQGMMRLQAVASSVSHLIESGEASKIFAHLFQAMGDDVQAVVDVIDAASFTLLSAYLDEEELKADITDREKAPLVPLFPLATFQSALNEFLQNCFTPAASPSYAAHVQPLVALLTPHSAAAASPAFLRSLYRVVLDQAQQADVEADVDYTKLFSTLIAPLITQLAASPSLGSFASSPAALRSAHLSLVHASFAYAVAQQSASAAPLFATLVGQLHTAGVMEVDSGLLGEWREHIQQEGWVAEKERELAYDAALAALK